MLGEDNNALTWLIILNALVFVSVLFIKVIYNFTSGHSESTDLNVANWVAMPAEGSGFLTRPWTILTYMFAHDTTVQGALFLVSSLFWLWCFGYILQDLAGNNKLFPVYIYGGLAGGLFFLITANLVPSMHANAEAYSLMGAGTSVMAVAIAVTTLTPTFRIMPMLNGGIPLWVITLIFVAIDFGTIGLANPAVAAAHVASGLTGFFFVYQLKRGNDIGQWMTNFVNWINDLFNPEKKYQEQKFLHSSARKPFEKKPHFSQQKLDEILDKINEKGYHLLTEEEKEFLKQASKENL